MAFDQFGIDVAKGAADILCEGKIRIPVGIEIIIENPAHPARFVPVRQEEIFIAPFFEPVVIIIVMRVTGRLQRAVKIRRVGILREYRGQVSPTAEPCLGGHDMAGIHMNRRDMR